MKNQNVSAKNDTKKKTSRKKHQTKEDEVPKTFLQLLQILFRTMAKRMVWRVVFGVLVFVLIFFFHTYLMVVINDTLYIVENNKVLSMILNLISRTPQTRAETMMQRINAILFWSLVSVSAFGTLARVISFGIKSFAAEVVHMFVVAYESLTDRNYKVGFIRIITGLVIGILLGTFVFNNMVCLVAAVFMFLSSSQQEKSMFVLSFTLIKSDWQRYLRIKNPKIFNINGYIILSNGISLGLLVAAVIPPVVFGSTAVSVVLKLAFAIGIIMSMMRVRSKSAARLFAILIPLGILLVLSRFNLFADDTGWTESGSNLKGWLNNSGTPLAVRLGISPALLSSLATVLGSAFPGFIKEMLNTPNMNPYQFIRNNLTPEQHARVRKLTEEHHQAGIDAANAEAEAYNSLLGFWGSFFEGCGSDMAEIGGAVKDFTKTLVIDLPAYVLENPYEAAGNSATFVKQVGGAIKNLAVDAAGVISDLFANNGELLIETIELTVEQIMTDPVGSGKKVAKSLYEMSGLKELVECTDPNKSATERAGLYSIGVMKLWGMIEGAGATADISKAGAKAAIGKLKNLADDMVKAAGGSSDDLVRILGKSKEEVVQMLKKSGSKLTPDDLERLYIHKLNMEAGEQTTKRLIDAIDAGDDDLLRQVLDIQQDKSAMRALNELEKTRPDVIKEFNKRMESVYENVDELTRREIADELGLDLSKLEVAKPTNPPDPTKIRAGYDRDITIRYDGKDLDPSEWRDIYRKHLYKQTEDHLPDGINKSNILDKLDQTCTSKTHLESYGSDESAIDLVRGGRTHDITNAQQVGDAISYKGLKHFEEASKLRTVNPSQCEKEIREGMRQLTKQWDNQITAAAKQFGATPDPKLKQAIDIMRHADNVAPVQVERALQAIGYTKEQVAIQLGEQFDAIVRLGRMR